MNELGGKVGIPVSSIVGNMLGTKDVGSETSI